MTRRKVSYRIVVYIVMAPFYTSFFYFHFISPALAPDQTVFLSSLSSFLIALTREKKTPNCQCSSAQVCVS